MFDPLVAKEVLGRLNNSVICRDFCSQMRRLDGFARWYGGTLLCQIGTTEEADLQVFQTF